MRITADGYDTVAQYIRVAEPSASVAVELEKSEEETTEESTSEKETDKETDKKTDNKDDDEEETTSKKYQSKSPDDGDEEENSVEVESSEKKSEEEDSKNSVASSTGRYKVYIDAPDGAEAYLDGSYIGITPISFNKVPGSYVVTLRKSGYQTRSYTIQIDEEEKDINYSFTDLMKLDD